jgi:hypothetical protein
MSAWKFVPHAITDAHDRSSSRMSGWTAVAATYVQALRMVVLKHAGTTPAVNAGCKRRESCARQTFSPAHATFAIFETRMRPALF